MRIPVRYIGCPGGGITKEKAVRNPKRTYQRKASEKGALKLKRSYRTS